MNGGRRDSEESVTALAARGPATARPHQVI